MKITAVETHVCNARMRNWVFVKVVTDLSENALYFSRAPIPYEGVALARRHIGSSHTVVPELWPPHFQQPHPVHGHILLFGFVSQ